MKCAFCWWIIVVAANGEQESGSSSTPPSLLPDIKFVEGPPIVPSADYVPAVLQPRNSRYDSPFPSRLNGQLRGSEQYGRDDNYYNPSLGQRNSLPLDDRFDSDRERPIPGNQRFSSFESLEEANGPYSPRIANNFPPYNDPPYFNTPAEAYNPPRYYAEESFDRDDFYRGRGHGDDDDDERGWRDERDHGDRGHVYGKDREKEREKERERLKKREKEREKEFEKGRERERERERERGYGQGYRDDYRPRDRDEDDRERFGYPYGHDEYSRQRYSDRRHAFHGDDDYERRKNVGGLFGGNNLLDPNNLLGGNPSNLLGGNTGNLFGGNSGGLLGGTNLLGGNPGNLLGGPPGGLLGGGPPNLLGGNAGNLLGGGGGILGGGSSGLLKGGAPGGLLDSESLFGRGGSGGLFGGLL